MFILALIPGPGVLVVIGRSLSGGLAHGIATSIGIVLGDYVFILLSVYGLIAIAEVMGNLFFVIKYVGAAYLIWLGLHFLRTPKSNTPVQENSHQTYWADGLVGLITTLSNPKAILFYLSFFPAFLDLTSVSLMDVSLILFIATITVGGVMVAYAYIAVKGSSWLRTSATGDNNDSHHGDTNARPSTIARKLNIAAGGILVGSGAFMVLKQ